MGKQYQTTDLQASMPGLTMPEQVSVALAEIAESATEAWGARSRSVVMLHVRNRG